ncbi:hypothetical protein Pla163_25900 [Planctomycetes bacterium Pla163]|uniref:Uncharacterized protein n=1 Tax=Rohdeia mirabilis TaxID=2528008 RepID=A0A518D1V5_9BACT|nr:hypothetical protein Pla163_25900 [Planctomycetes bacterium Pla163]
MNGRNEPQQESASAHGYALRSYESGDEAAVLETFNRVFAAIDPTFEPRDLRTWRWLFEGNPSGRRLWLAVTPEGRIVAQCAGIAQRMLIDGEPTFVSQSIDSMADPTFTQGLKRPGAFVRTCLGYWDAYSGSGPDRDAFVWGWPVETAWRIGKSQLKYEVVRTQGLLFATERTFAAGPAPGIDVAEVASFDEDVRELFDRVAPTSRCIAVRDAPQLTWRFLERPGFTYRIATARRAGRLVGLAVFRDGSFEGVPCGALCEWLIDPDVPEAGHALAHWAFACTLEAGRDELVVVLPDSRPWWMLMQSIGFRVRPTKYFPVARYFSKRHHPRWLWDHWYYTLADTDLV